MAPSRAVAVPASPGASRAPAVPAPPVTPVRKKPGTGVGAADPGREQAERLNDIYNLGLVLPEGPQSPADTERRARVDAAFRRHSSIVQLLRVHHYRDPGRLEAVLADFDAQARAQHSNWVPKARATRGLLPSPRQDGAPRARPGLEQAALQELLLTLLEASKATLVAQATPRSLAKAPAPTPTPAPAPAPATETSVSGPVSAPVSYPTLRIGRHQGTGSSIAAAIDSVPVVSRTGASVLRSAARTAADRKEAAAAAVPEEAESRSRSQSASSVSTMYSALASFEGLPDSQTTVGIDDGEAGELSTKDGDAAQALRRTASQESFAVSDSSLEALEASFNLYDTRRDDIAQQQAPHSPASTTTAYSSIPDMENLRLSDVLDEPAETRPAAAELGLDRLDPVPGLWHRLLLTFPTTPGWLEEAPFPIIWETTRIAQKCGVDLGAVDLSYSPAWERQGAFYEALAGHPEFAGKRFPERSSQVAWDTALGRHISHGGTKRVAVYSVHLRFSRSASGPLYVAQLQPLSIDLPHRLGRHFGADRFVEVVFPSHHSDRQLVPHILRNHEAAVQEVNAWLTRHRHDFVGRTWAAFYAKDDGIKEVALPTASRAASGNGEVALMLKRLYLFAEEGVGIAAEDPPAADAALPSSVRVHDMLDWLLQFNKFPENRRLPYLKLFSRIALGLSRTKPTVVFEPHQLRHQTSDLLSPTGRVMNDGVARMSLSVARKLRAALEVSDLPVAVQGRIGSAKGMWILDTEDTGREDWLETYPSQRKWTCDYADADQRTLEVRNFASEVRSASLNLQFIPVLEDRAVDQVRMRRVLGSILEGSLARDLADQRAALEHPLLFAAWAHENARFRDDRVVHNQVPFLGGLPDQDEDTIQFLLAGGFDPLAQKMLWNLVYDMQLQRLQRLQEKLSVRVGRAAYLLMVVDFLGVLAEGEVQVCFSSKFQVEADGPADEGGDDGSFSDTLLVGTDVLVARSPAHFPSDMQRVRAVFRPELCALKDVVVFSRHGDGPLADKLSGGDYDGDMAWVCWDPRIVRNFANAPDPPHVDLQAMGYMRKIRTTADELTAEAAGLGSGSGARERERGRGLGGGLPAAAVGELIERSFAFSLRESVLGKLTRYKEVLCYEQRSICSRTAMILSTLLGDLVDQAKQGNDFTMDDFERLRVECLEGEGGRPPDRRLQNPAYKSTSRGGGGGGGRHRRSSGRSSGRASRTWGLDGAAAEEDVLADHIIDYLKFAVAEPVIEREMQALDAFPARRGRRGRGGRAGLDDDDSDNDEEGDCRPEFWDADLAAPAKHFQAVAATSAACAAALVRLTRSVEAVGSSWDRLVGQRPYHAAAGAAAGAADGAEESYRQRVLQVYEAWCEVIRGPDMTGPVAEGQKEVVEAAARRTVAGLVAAPFAGCSAWALVCGSQLFRMFYRRRPKMVWRMAGRQLQAIKALAGGPGHGGGGGLGGATAVVTPAMFAALKPDKKLIQRMAARQRGGEVAGVDYAEGVTYADDT